MRTWIKTLTTLLVLGCASPALAAGEHYVGAGLGAFNLSNGVNRDTVFGGYVILGHHFNEYLSAEIRLGGTASSGDGDALIAQPKQRRRLAISGFYDNRPFSNQAFLCRNNRYNHIAPTAIMAEESNMPMVTGPNRNPS